jgi:hypothetical protein
MLAAAAGAALGQVPSAAPAQPGNALLPDPAKAPPVVSEKMLPPLPGLGATAAPPPETTSRTLPRWRNSGTWRDDYDPRHDAYRLGVFGSAVQPGVNVTPRNVWGNADPRNPPDATGGARQDRFAAPPEWGDEGGWDRGIWAGRSRRP